jgi:hypothetical protein
MSKYAKHTSRSFNLLKFFEIRDAEVNVLQFLYAIERINQIKTGISLYSMKYTFCEPGKEIDIRAKAFDIDKGIFYMLVRTCKTAKTFIPKSGVPTYLCCPQCVESAADCFGIHLLEKPYSYNVHRAIDRVNEAKLRMMECEKEALKQKRIQNAVNITVAFVCSGSSDKKVLDMLLHTFCEKCRAIEEKLGCQCQN